MTNSEKQEEENCFLEQRGAFFVFLRESGERVRVRVRVFEERLQNAFRNLAINSTF